MARWTGGFCRMSLADGGGGPFFDVAASLLLSPDSGTLAAAPTWNAVFFHGDRVAGDPAIERLSDPEIVARIVASKLGAGTNAWAVKPSEYRGPFAVYEGFVPTVDQFGDPEGYNPEGFPASTAIASLICRCLAEVRKVIPLGADGPGGRPSTVILGFSKGGTVVNQVLAEISRLEPESSPGSRDPFLFPCSAEALLRSISDLHYVDVGLNRPGAYLVDPDTVDRIARRLLAVDGGARLWVLLHGTPRQWRDDTRPWICDEKDEMVRLLLEGARRSNGRLHGEEKLYFANRPPSMRMHFEIIESMDLR